MNHFAALSPRHPRSAWFATRLLAWWLATASSWAFASEPPVRAAVSFSRDVQPLFAQKCFACHGRDRREGGLSLLDRDSALAPLESGERAVVPSRPDASELLRRVTSNDADERMPPRGEPLGAEQVAMLRGWIEAGAAWESHWAYAPLSRPVVPWADGRIRSQPTRLPMPSEPPSAVPPSVPSASRLPSETTAPPPTAVDAFLAVEQSARGVTVTGAAERRVLLRRLAFDLTGLPPSPDAVAEFLGDSGPDAYERQVDRWLASPRLGERWARHWMDIVHFAETHGHDQDRPRPNAWPYRDYLIRAFNDDKPYGDFVREQVAGDVWRPDDPQAIAATGLLAAGPWDESSLRDIREDSIDREIARYLDRDDIVTTVLNTFASTTVHCARCHDHKFDPVTQADYYSLQAVFAATDKANRAYDADPATARRRRELAERQRAAADWRRTNDPRLLAADVQGDVERWERQVVASAGRWQVATPSEARSQHGATLTIQGDGSILSGGTRPERDTYVLVFPVKGPRVTGLRLEVLTDASLAHQGPGRQDNGNLHLNEIVVTVSGQGATRATATAGADPSPKRLTLRNPQADFNQDGWTIAHALDGNPATAWGIYPAVGKSHRAVFELAEPLATDDGVVLTVELQQTHGGGHLIGRPRVSITTAPLPLPVDAETLPATVAAALAIPAAQRSDAQRSELASYVIEQDCRRQLTALPPQQMVYCGTSRFEADGSFRPAAKPRVVHVLHRGDIHQPRDEASPGVMSIITGLPARFELATDADEASRRLALAEWLVDSRNGLTWRSIANRVWQYHFGRGIVDTPSDFGAMGGRPSHPELLDWLAVTLQEEQGSLKRLHRRLVTTAAYRRSSSHVASSAQIDADNRLLWRMNRTRLDAEALHDAVASASGTIDLRMGGPSVRQFVQSPGIHVTPVVDYLSFQADDRANYRRSVYRFLFRTLPDPFMEALDCPDASQLTPTRNVSVTALQALALWNDKFMVRQCEHLADRAAREHWNAASAPNESLQGIPSVPSVSEQVDSLFQWILLRSPSDAERPRFVEFAARHGLANTARVLLNTSEFVFVD